MVIAPARHMSEGKESESYQSGGRWAKAKS